MSSNTTLEPTTAVRAGRHPVNVGHLVMGLAFLCFTAGWGLVQADVVTGSDIRWLLPIPWLVAGAVGLAAITTSTLRKPVPSTSTGTSTGTSTSTSTGTSTTDIQEQP